MEQLRYRVVILAGLAAALLLARPVGTADTGGNVSACTAATLAATAGWQGATGALAGAVRVTNIGSASCALAGSPKLQVLDANGSTLAIDQMRWPNAPSPATVLSPGDQASAPFAWRNWCRPAPAGPLSLQVTLPRDGGEFRVPATNPAGEPQRDTPRCDDPRAPATIASGGFTPSASPAGAVVTVSLNLRAGPSRATAVLLVVPAGSVVTVTGAVRDGFVPVAFAGTPGWAFATYPRVTPTPSPGLALSGTRQGHPVGRVCTTPRVGIDCRSSGLIQSSVRSAG